MVLELDVGNSRIKWRQLNGDGGIVFHGVVPGLSELMALDIAWSDLVAVRVCSVRKGELLERLLDWLSASHDLAGQVAKVERECGGVKIHYEDPSRLGVDRWLAMLAAFSCTQDACLIVDGGTALTIDVISADGEHEGGYILPGLSMMRESLEHNTAIRLLTAPIPWSVELGHSTEEAVWNGSFAAITALIQKTSLMKTAGQQRPRILFSGGDAEALLEIVASDLHKLNRGNEYKHRQDVELVPDLVLDGLAIACPV